MPRGKTPPMNPKHRDAICSAGLHLLQELSTVFSRDAFHALATTRCLKPSKWRNSSD
jgi:hypothetical protein